MQNVIVEAGQNEDSIINIIFDAARANSQRQQRLVRHHWVMFAPIGSERHVANVFLMAQDEEELVLIASAIIDKHDC